MQIEDELPNQQAFALPQPLARDQELPEINWDEKIPLDQLVGAHDIELPENLDVEEPIQNLPVQEQQIPTQNLNIGIWLF